MPSVADCLRQHGETFLQQYSSKISLQQRKVLSTITRCRTGELGSVIFACDGCGRQHWVGRSCGNRHCPSCGWKGGQVSIAGTARRVLRTIET